MSGVDLKVPDDDVGGDRQAGAIRGGIIYFHRDIGLWPFDVFVGQIKEDVFCDLFVSVLKRQSQQASLGVLWSLKCAGQFDARPDAVGRQGRWKLASVDYRTIEFDQFAHQYCRQRVGGVVYHDGVSVLESGRNVGSWILAIVDDREHYGGEKPSGVVVEGLGLLHVVDGGPCDRRGAVVKLPEEHAAVDLPVCPKVLDVHFRPPCLCQLRQVYKLVEVSGGGEKLGEILSQAAVAVDLVVVFFDRTACDVKLAFRAEGFDGRSLRQRLHAELRYESPDEVCVGCVLACGKISAPDIPLVDSA